MWQLLLYLVALASMRIGIAVVEQDVFGIPNPGGSPWFNILCTAIFLLGYVFLVRLIEKRNLSEFSRMGALSETAIGVAIGAILFTIVIGIVAAANAFDVTAARIPAHLWAAVTLWVFGAISEEIGLRAVIFRLVERWSGSWIALFLSAAIFGAIHLGNQDVSLAGVIGIAVGSGILYAAVFMITRRLWAVIGIHFAWNMCEGTIFGTPVSGFDFDSFLVSNLSGPTWLTGGRFGPEASIPALIVLTLAGTAALALAHRRGQFIGPLWRVHDSENR